MPQYKEDVKMTMGPIPWRRLPEPELLVVERAGMKEFHFVGLGDRNEASLHEASLHTGSIDADDVSVVMYAGKSEDWGYLTRIDTKTGKSYIVQGEYRDTMEILFGREDDSDRVPEEGAEDSA